MPRLSKTAAVIALVLLAGPAIADAQSVTNVPAGALSASSAAASLVRVVGALALVVGVCLCGVWLFRNWQRFTSQKLRAPKLNVLEVKSLGHRHALYVIAYEQQRLLLAASPTGVTLLTQLPAAGPGAPEPEPASAPMNFAEVLAHAAGRNR
jgi:flagellar biogenesis protein FliO